MGNTINNYFLFFIFDKYDKNSIYDVNFMMIARIIKLKYQLIFYLSKIRIIDFLFDDKKLTSCTNLNPPNKLWFWIMPIFL